MRVIESDVRRDVALFFQPVAPFRASVSSPPGSAEIGIIL